MLKKSIVGIGIFAFILAGSVSATLTDDLVRQGMGVRAMGMGSTATAVGGDASALFYNPAGLADLLFEYSVGSKDVNRDVYTSSRYDLLSLGSFCYANYGLSTSLESASTIMYGFGSKGGGGFNWGLSYKTAQWNLSSGVGQGWSSDIGILLKVTPALSLGVLGQDIASQRGFLAASSTRLGVALMPLLDRMIFAGDLEIDEARKNENLTHFGMEIEIAEGLKARLGSDRGLVTAGASFQLPFIELDYAMKNRGGNEGLLQCFGGSLRLVKKRERTLSLLGPKEYAVVEIRGTIAGGDAEFSLLKGYREGLDNILTVLRQARKDKGIAGIIIKLTDFSAGLGGAAVAQEIREELKLTKADGKKVVVYIEDSGLGEGGYLASVADKIVAPRGASLGGLSQKIEITRLKGFYDKIGIEWQVLTQGANKDTFSPYKESLTKEQNEILVGVVEDFYRQMLTDIAADRKVELAALKKIGDGRILTATEAKNLNLIDEIGYFEDAVHLAGKLVDAKEDLNLVEPQNLMQEKDMQDYLFSYFNKVAIIEVDGEIVIGGSGGNFIFGDSYIGSDTVTQQIRDAVKDPQIKAIILRVNSPGGSAIASGQIYKEILKAREKGKVVVASLASVAASGGYYIACAANSIVANPGTITGSIGVIGALPAIAELYGKVGIKREVVQEGKYADLLSGINKLSKEETATILRLQKDTYDEFVEKVIAGRALPTAEVKAVADGRILTGRQAFNLGFVDELGGFQKAVEAAKEAAKIKGEPILVYFGKRNSWFSQMGNSLLKALGFSDGILPKANQNNLNSFKLY